jgi:hypothetical protein
MKKIKNNLNEIFFNPAKNKVDIYKFIYKARIISPLRRLNFSISSLYSTC